MRIFFAVVFWILEFAALVYGGTYFFGLYGVVVGACLSIALLGYSIRWFLVSVPEVTGLLTVNLFSGALTPYGTGLHFRFPWEQVKDGNYINIRIITQEFGKDGKSLETYPSADGPEMLVKWSFQYKAHLELLGRYIAVDETTINEGLREIGSSFLSGKISTFKAEELSKTNRGELEQELVDHFEKKKHRMRLDGEVREGTLEELYGIDLIVVSLSDVDFSARYQEARETSNITKQLRNAANDLRTVEIINPDGTTTTRTDESMSHGDALNNVLVIGGKVKKNIQAVEGTGAQAAFAFLQSIFGGSKA